MRTGVAEVPLRKSGDASAGSHVAFATLGSGSPLVMVPGWLCHLEQSWTHPAAASARAKLASEHRFIWYDRLGCGLSDRDGFELTLDNDVEQLVAVLDATEVERTHLIGYSFGVPPAVLFAARFPERVDRLVLCSGFARGTAMMTRETLDALVQLIDADWEMAAQLLSARWLPNASSQDLRWFSRFQQDASDAQMATRLLEHTWAMDVREVLSRLEVPTLVIHDRHDQTIPMTAAEEIEALVPGSELCLLDGNEHDPFIRDSGSLVDIILDFVNERPIREPSTPTPPDVELSPREREVLRLIASGATNAEIADELSISVKTVERHVTTTYRKVGARGRADATRCAVTLGVVSPGALA